jgi:Xaa-Pro aminopeptidase
VSRLARLQALLEEPLLVTKPVNVLYLTGFDSSNPALLVEPDRARLFSDFRYAEAGRAIEGVEFVEASRSLLADLAERLEGRVGFESEHVSYAGSETLRAGGLELVPRAGLVEGLRAVKDEAELEAMRRASAITSEAYDRLASERFVGRTERELAWRMQELFHELGADGAAFDTIVAAGANGARPHADPGERTIEAGQLVVVDAGAKLDGYCSDCTRTFATGPLPERLKEAYAVCLQAQQAGLEGVRPAMAGIDADGVARAVVESSPFAGTFGHGLGHGVGLEVHEAPRLSPTAAPDEVLAAGNVFSVEPGVYLEGEGGVRIEDLVALGPDGIEVLTTFTKDLVTVD